MFEPPEWSAVLTAAAAAGLLWELAALLASIWRGRHPGKALAMTVGSLLAGPIVAPVAAVYGGMTTPPDQPLRGRALILSALHGTLLCGLAGLLVFGRDRTDPGLPSGPILVLTVCAALWCVRSYRRTTSPLRPMWKGLLLALRLAVVVLLSVCAARPMLAYRHEEEIRGVVLLGIDASTSMQRQDMPRDYPDTWAEPEGDGISRILAVERELKRSRRELDDLTEQADVAVFTFSGTYQPLADLPPEDPAEMAIGTPVGRTTAIGDAAQDSFDSCVRDGRDVAAILLISDGCNNTAERIAPESFAALVGARGLPIHTIGVGSDTVTASARSLSVRDLVSQDEIDAFRRLPISATIEVLGLANREVRLICRFGGEEVGTQTLAIADNQVRQAVQWEHVPLRTGFHRLTVTAQCAGKQPEGLSGQRVASQLVHVVDRDLRVLYIEGKVRFELKFITQALAAGERIHVVRTAPQSEEMEDWLAFHAILFGDVDSSRFTGRQLEIVRDLVGKYGKGFCMIGGTRSFGAGGWADTPIADVLPVDLQTSVGQIDRLLKVVPTREGAQSDLMRIGDDRDVVAAWARLDPLPGANRLAGLKPAATVLAAAPDGAPLIVSQPYGKGRSMAIAFDTTYKWVLTPKDTAALQKRFWRQVALFLCAPKGNVWITTNRSRYDLRRLAGVTQFVEVTAGVEDPQGRPLVQAPVKVTLAAPDKPPVPLQLKGEENLRRIKLPGSVFPRPGLYTLKIETQVAGRELAAEHRFEVIERDLEALDALANFDLLRRVAAESGGTFATLSGLAEVLRDVQIDSRPKIRERIETRDLTAELRWPLLVVLAALLCIEWAVRKRRGLV